MKVVLIFDQGLAGAGGKGHPNVGLQLEKGGIGSYLMLEPHFKQINASVVATLYCGNEFFLDNKDEVVKKMTAMIKKINPDIVVCGPCFNFADYALMSAMITKSVLDNTDVACVSMMSKENESVINEYASLIPIIKMPKKGGTGLNDSLQDLSKYMEAKVNNSSDFEEIKSRICY